MLNRFRFAGFAAGTLRVTDTQQVPKGPRETTSPAWAAFVLAKKTKREGPNMTGQLETTMMPVVLRGPVP